MTTAHPRGVARADRAPAPLSFREGELLRPARPEDNADLLRLFGEIPMSGDLVLSTERGPLFTALVELQRGATEVWVFEKAGKLCGCCAFVVRDGWVSGKPQRVCYLGDLRAGAGARGVLPRYYGELFEQVARRHEVRHFYTGILASNRAALRALTRRRPGRERQPVYDLFREYDAVQVHFTRRQKPPNTRGLQVHTATKHDIADIVDRLDQDHRHRPFGYRWNTGELEHRLSCWPGFDLASTYVARNQEGKVVGVTTAWDAAPIKQYRVHEYRGRMRWIEHLFRASSFALGHALLPKPGECFRYRYLTNLSIDNDDPKILSALLRHVYAELFDQRYHFLMLYLEQGSRLAPALDGFRTQRLPFHQFTVRPADTPREDYGNNTSGFEIALA